MQRQQSPPEQPERAFAHRHQRHNRLNDHRRQTQLRRRLPVRPRHQTVQAAARARALPQPQPQERLHQGQQRDVARARHESLRRLRPQALPTAAATQVVLVVLPAAARISAQLGPGETDQQLPVQTTALRLRLRRREGVAEHRPPPAVPRGGLHFGRLPLRSVQLHVGNLPAPLPRPPERHVQGADASRPHVQQQQFAAGGATVSVGGRFARFVAAAAVVGRPQPARAERVRQVQPELQDDLRPGVPHALAPQTGGGRPPAAQARGEAEMPGVQRELQGAPPPDAPHDGPSGQGRRPRR